MVHSGARRGKFWESATFDSFVADSYDEKRVRPRGGIGIHSRLRACALQGISVRVGAGAPNMGCVKSLLTHPFSFCPGIQVSPNSCLASGRGRMKKGSLRTETSECQPLASLCAQAKSIVEVPEGPHSLVNRSRAEILFDSKQLIVFGDAVAACGRSCLDLPGVEGHDQVGNGVILSLA